MNSFIVFQASREQLRQIVANAINASLGLLIDEPEDVIKADNVKLDEFLKSDDTIYVHDYKGRIVRLAILSHGLQYKLALNAQPEYQTWVNIYGSARGLLESVEGVEIV